MFTYAILAPVTGPWAIVVLAVEGASAEWGALQPKTKSAHKKGSEPKTKEIFFIYKMDFDVGNPKVVSKRLYCRYTFS